MLNQVADGVWVRQSAWVWSNAIAVRGEGGLILVDPGIDGSDLNQLADDLDRLGLPVVAIRHPSPLGPPALASPNDVPLSLGFVGRSMRRCGGRR
jgi:hypothetical protein